MQSKVTLKEVAALSGVSYQTVSKVLHGKMNVRQDTLEKISAAIDQLGYVPNQAARNLRSTHSMSVGYTWEPSDLPNSILEEFLQGMMGSTNEQGYQLVCFPSLNGLSTFDSLYASRKVDGFILSHIVTQDPRVIHLQQQGIPFVCFGDAGIGDVTCVDVDGKEGMRKIIQHLFEHGHETIGLLAWAGESRVGNDRFQGFVEGMRQCGMTVQDPLIKRGEGTVESGYLLTRELLLGETPDAIVAFNDLMAIGAIRAIRESGLTPGEDIAITGFDDFPLAAYLSPSLTTIRQPARVIGQLVVQLLVEQIEKERKVSPSCRLFSPELVIRESSSIYHRSI